MTNLMRLLCVVAIAAILYLGVSSADLLVGWVDLKAMVIVFVTPLLLSFLFQKEPLQLRWLRSRLSELKSNPNESLVQELTTFMDNVDAEFLLSKVVKLEDHSDSMVRYGSRLISSRYSGEQVASLVGKRINAEDHLWKTYQSLAGFLAKMAPYFGMLATVMGMVQLLASMNDFTKISAGMALAMQGTLFGLVSFTVLYAPLQRFFENSRERVFLRNQLLGRWFILIAERQDPTRIREELWQLSEETRLKTKSPTHSMEPSHGFSG